MRKIILDTETTGLDIEKDKIIEVGCVEILNDVPTGKTFHSYFNPGSRVISPQAEEVHGLSNKFLKNFDYFERKAEQILKFIGDSLIIIHNAAFDLTMINNELKNSKRTLINESQVFCTLLMAKKKFPGTKVNLNALCKRFGISIGNRIKHDAITDCFLLAQVYLELIGGKQHKLSFKADNHEEKIYLKQSKNVEIRNTKKIELQDYELELHSKSLRKIKKAIWLNK